MTNSGEEPIIWDKLIADCLEGTFNISPLDWEPMAHSGEETFQPASSMSEMEWDMPTPPHMGPYNLQGSQVDTWPGGIYQHEPLPIRAANVSQNVARSAPPAPGHPVEKKNEDSKTVMKAEKKGKKKKSGDDDSYTIEDIFNESGFEWGKMEQVDEYRRHIERNTEKMEAYETALECLICGNRLNISGADGEEFITMQVINGCCEVCGLFSELWS